MKSIGEILKTNREYQKISISDVSKELKISQEILLNLENNYFKKDADSVFTIGHLRSYSSFLDLNTNEIVDQFKKEHLTESKKNIEIKRPIFDNKLLFFNKFVSLSIILIVSPSLLSGISHLRVDHFQNQS